MTFTPPLMTATGSPSGDCRLSNCGPGPSARGRKMTLRKLARGGADGQRRRNRLRQHRRGQQLGGLDRLRTRRRGRRV